MGGGKWNAWRKQDRQRFAAGAGPVQINSAMKFRSNVGTTVARSRRTQASGGFQAAALSIHILDDLEMMKDVTKGNEVKTGPSQKEHLRLEESPNELEAFLVKWGMREIRSEVEQVSAEQVEELIREEKESLRVWAVKSNKNEPS